MDTLEWKARLICEAHNAAYFLGHIFVPSGEIATMRRNVILSYGYGGTPNVMASLARELGRHGYHAIVPDVGFAMSNIQRLAEAFAARVVPMVERARSKNPHVQIAMIGHSMGGLIIAHARRGHPLLRAIPLIAMGTPFWGSNLARYLPWSHFAPNSAARLMWPDSSFLAELRADIRAHPDHLYRIVASRDKIISEGLDLPMIPKHIMKNRGHISMIYRPRMEILAPMLELALIEAGA